MERDKKISINKELDSGKPPIDLTKDELHHAIKNPLAKSRYSSALQRKIRKPRPAKHKQIVCDVCKNTYTQSNVSHHRKSKHHLFCEEMNQKFLSILYD